MAVVAVVQKSLKCKK